MLHLRGVGDDAAAEHPGGTRHVAEPGADHAPGEGLGHPEAEPALATEHAEHDRLHRVVVHAEHDRPEERPDHRLLVCEDPSHVGRIGALGGDADLQALHARGEERDGRGAAPVELVDARRQDLGQA